MVAHRKRRYCHFCSKHCLDKNWHGVGDDYQFCHTGYMFAYRHIDSPLEPCHPMWISLKSRVHSMDETGSLIVALQYRPDYRALQSVASLMAVSEHWHSLTAIIFLSPLLLQAYWSFPMCSLWSFIENMAFQSVSAAFLKAQWQRLEEMYLLSLIHI